MAACGLADQMQRVSHAAAFVRQGHLAMSGDIFAATSLEVAFHWRLVGRGQGCWNPYSAQETPHNKVSSRKHQQR